VFLRSLSKIPTVILPKVDDAECVRRFWKDFGSGSELRIFPLIESFRGVANAGEICRESSVCGVGLGLEDLLAGCWQRVGKIGALIGAVKSSVVLAAKASGISAVDTISLEWKDEARFGKECEESRSFGFDGRFTIHPRQISVCRKVFAPDDAEIEWAQRVKELTDLDGAAGYQVLGGEILSPPKILRAKAILEHTEKTEL
jgi:citrate lyase subunit beta/citryl-CoA lyase